LGEGEGSEASRVTYPPASLKSGTRQKEAVPQETEPSAGRALYRQTGVAAPGFVDVSAPAFPLAVHMSGVGQERPRTLYPALVVISVQVGDAAVGFTLR
jgi:hypothetical protein